MRWTMNKSLYTFNTVLTQRGVPRAKWCHTQTHLLCGHVDKGALVPTSKNIPQRNSTQLSIVAIGHVLDFCSP